MVRYVKTLDELVEIVDRDLSGKNAVCPVCKHKIGTVGIPDIDLGLDNLNFMEFKHAGVFCTNGHCIISMEVKEKDDDIKRPDTNEKCRLHIEDLGIKVFEVMKLIKPYLGIDEAIPNSQLYWALMNKEKPAYTEPLPRNVAYDLMEDLQKLGARVRMV
ncbi:hypothetical protein OXPF_00870 [Oxobacter pfennigii]|uniref:Uncharacterized protein n=1 Tax=Oxobacter pfennigii TaxID=36849 RepID=A0A0P8Z2B6_9CLOT|nr:hypothetical protein [Oxobacter pfennigii]KPU46300.1 hypothetical protein OXPF_00870 [Oxobacter pfennigii]